MKLTDSESTTNSDDSDNARRFSDIADDDDGIDNGAGERQANQQDVRGNLERELKQLARLMRRESSILKHNVSAQRDKVRRECEALLKRDEHRHYALNILWIHYWYAPVKTIIGKPKISDSLRAWLKNFVVCGIRHLENIAAKYTDLCPVTLVFVGDLHRYSYVNCGRADADFENSRASYLAAFEANTFNGRPFNQLALLWQENGDVWKSLGHFLKALAVREPFARAVDNVKRLDEHEFDKEIGHNATFNFVHRLILPFNHATVEKWRKLFEAALDANLSNSEWQATLEMIHYLTCLIVFYSRGEGYDDQIRVLSVVLCQSWTSLINKFIEKPDNDFLLAVLAGAGEFVSRLLLPKKTTVSLKFQYQNVVQLYVELLNANIDNIRRAEVDPEKLTKKAESLWITNAPLVANSDVEVVVAFMKSAVDNLVVPLSFDGEHFRAASLTNLAGGTTAINETVQVRKCLSTVTLKATPPLPANSEKSKSPPAEDKNDKVKLMEKIGKLHAEFCQREKEKKQHKSMLPVYLFPDASVFLDKLSVLQNLAALMLRNNHRFIVIVAELVLRQLDRQKRENQRAREAIRWLQSVLTGGVGNGGKIRLEMMSVRDGDVPNAALQFVKEQKLLDRKSLFATVLTAAKQPTASANSSSGDNAAIECSLKESVFGKYNSLSLENIDAFFLRIVELEDGDPYS